MTGIRTNLIMHFHCSECGRQLKIDYPEEAKAKPVDARSTNQVPQEDTGGVCFYTPIISIRPCQHCIKKHTEPAKKLMQAIKDLTANE